MIYQKRCDTENTVDVSEDFVLPDYCPEVRRVLGVTARASVGENTSREKSLKRTET